MKVGGIQEGRLAVIQDAIGTNSVSSKGTTTGSTDKGKWLGLEEDDPHPSLPRRCTTPGAGRSCTSYCRHKKYTEASSRSTTSTWLGATPASSARSLARGGYNMRTVEADEQIKLLLKKYLRRQGASRRPGEGVAPLRALAQVRVGPRLPSTPASFALSRNMPIKAQRLLQISIDMESKNPMTWMYLGMAQSQKRNYTGAIASFDKAIAMDPLAGMLYIHKARCLDRGGDKEAAKKVRKLALEIDPDNDSVVMESAWDEMTGR